MNDAIYENPDQLWCTEEGMVMVIHGEDMYCFADRDYQLRLDPCWCVKGFGYEGPTFKAANCLGE